MSETPAERNRRIFEEATAAGEPVFVIRAKDKWSVEAIYAYDRLVEDDVGSEFRAAIDDLVDDFARWRVDHVDQIKAPDVRTDAGGSS